jgi:hypothetical protein
VTFEPRAKLLLALLATAPAAAQANDPPPAAPADDDTVFHAGFDAWAERASPFRSGIEGETYDPDLQLSARLRAGFEARLAGPKFRLLGEADFLALRHGGEPTEVGTYRVDPDLKRNEQFHPFPVSLRTLYLEWRPFFGLFRVGQQASDWGLGIVAQSGARDARLFGDAMRGSLSERALFATSPFQAIGARPQSLLGRLTFVVAGDLVFADETATLLRRRLRGRRRGLSARPLGRGTAPNLRERRETITVARHDVSGGFYGVRRTQTYAEGDTLDVWVLDGALASHHAFKGGASLRFGLEGAYLTGETNRIETEASQDGLDVAAWGMALEADAGFRRAGCPFHVAMLGGLASGDRDPDDGETNRFTFHGDYDVGLILFDQVVPALQRRATERIEDPLRSKQPPRGYQHFAGRGGVSGASYGLLRATVGPAAGVTAGLQAMSAATTGPFADPYQTFAAGGSPRNPFGGPGEGTFGTELTAALRVALPAIGAGLEPAVRATYGVLLPGDVLKGPDAELGTVHFVQLKLSLDAVRGGGR